jgi:hypothetical protein
MPPVLAKIISSTPKMEAMCSSETPAATQQTTRRHIPEDDTLQIGTLFSRSNIWRNTETYILGGLREVYHFP